MRNVQGLSAQGQGRLKMMVQLRSVTLSVVTLIGCHCELAEILKNRWVNITCIQWRGSEAKEIGYCYKLIYYGTSTVRNGVAVVVNQYFCSKS